ncbi:MAG: alpha amylase catalytic region [Clostridiales bacterium]|jgi:alpha-glucosidase|nr:alpha amylase catalytic region [Clostridiales bacterium]
MNQLNWLESIYSETSEQYVTNLNPQIGETITITLRAFTDSPITKVFLRNTKNGEEISIPMLDIITKGKFTYYSAPLIIDQPSVKYSFFICTEEDVYFYNQLGVTEYVPLEDYEFTIIAEFNAATWLDDAIFYQIFVDRFFNGDESNDVQNGDYTYLGYASRKNEWDALPTPYEVGGNIDFSGGDLQGVTAKIPYLKSIGVNSVYLNPIFTAPSHHKYDCSNYLEVDPGFGGNPALIDLIEALHSNDMKIVLDISINHTGDLHNWVKEHKEFYFLKPDGNFEMWNDVPNLFSLNYTNEELQNLMYKNADSILKHWINPPYSIDGWRFDVGHNTGKMRTTIVYDKVWKDVRNEVKSIKPDAYLFAEHWADAAEYLQGDMWDSIMSYYYFNRPVRKYLGEFDHTIAWKVNNNKAKVKNGIIFKREVESRLAKIPNQVQRILFNQLDSHDIHRIGTTPSISRANVLTSIKMLMFFKGVPCIYYGDEIGLDGKLGHFEGCRYNFTWDEEKWDKEIYDTYLQMTALRKSSDVLKKGAHRFLLEDESAICYARFLDNEAYLLINSQYSYNRRFSLPIGLLGDCKNAEIIIGGTIIGYDKDFVNIELKAEETAIIKVDLV